MCPPFLVQAVVCLVRARVQGAGGGRGPSKGTLQEWRRKGKGRRGEGSSDVVGVAGGGEDRDSKVTRAWGGAPVHAATEGAFTAQGTHAHDTQHATRVVRRARPLNGLGCQE